MLSRLFARLPWALMWALGAQATLSITRFVSKMVVGGKFSDGAESGMGSAAELGYYDAAFGGLMLVVGLHEALVTTPLTFFNHRTKATDDQKFAGKMLIISALFSIVALVCMTLVVGGNFMCATQTGGLMAAMLALCLLLPFQLIRELARRWLLANLQVRQSAMIEILFAGVFLLLLVGLMWTHQVTAATVFVLTALANIACLLGWWVVYRKSFTLGSEGVLTQIGDNLRYGKWIACENACSVGIIYFSQWFIFAKLGETGAGVYSACMTIVLLTNPFLLGVASLFAPRAAQEFERKSWPGLIRMLFGYSLFLTSVLGSFCVVLYFYGDPLTQLVFGSQYQDYFVTHCAGINTTTFWMSLAMPCFGVSFLLTSCLLAADVPIYSFYSAMVGLVVSVLANLAFPEPTLNSAAGAFVAGVFAATLARAVFVFVTYRKQTRR